jgi:hypothetical protein
MNIKPENVAIALIQLDGLIAGVESNSSIPVQLSELKMLRALLGGKYDAPTGYTGSGVPAVQPALRAVSMGLFPTMGSLQQVVDLAYSQLPIQSPNAINALLMTYHNTLLDQVASCKPGA